MVDDRAIHSLIGCCSRFLSGEVDSTELIQRVDALVGDDLLKAFPVSLRDAVDKYQDEIALFTRDKRLIEEYPEHHFGIDELRKKTAAFLSYLQSNWQA